MSKHTLDDVDPAMKVLAGIFIVGALMYSCSPTPSSDGPVEHKCWTEVGYEKC